MTTNRLTIAIDFDDTYTADVQAWKSVIAVLQAHGHSVICVSARRNTFDHFIELSKALPDDVKVLLSYDCPKRQYAKSRGYEVDIWIDDIPEAIPTKQDMQAMCG